MLRHKFSLSAPFLALPFALVGAIATGCDGTRGSEDSAVDTAQAMTSGPAIDKTLAPIRSLEVPQGIYLTAVEQILTASGSFDQVVHVYQPDASGESIRFELAARASSGTIDASHKFTAVNLTSHPGESDETQQVLSNASGRIVYSVTTSRQGWYRLRFTYGAVNAGRTLSIKAVDASGQPLKLMWSDPPAVNQQVRATVQVEQTASVFLKGGAYRNTDAAEYAYVDNIKLDNDLLYRRGFDQGRFAFPLGILAPGQHVVEFSLARSGTGSAKFWFGINDQSFDPVAAKGQWDPVQFLYYGAMHTGDYDAWNDGVAFAQGATPALGVRPPPVRRGTTFSLAVEHPTLNGAGMNTMLRIYPLGSGSEVNWPRSLPAEYDYRGGISKATGLSPRYREHWRVSVPSDAPVGRYVVKAFTPGGVQIGADVLFYVIHNPYPLLAKGAITKAELETFAYDEDEDGVDLPAPFGLDRDNARDNFTVLYQGEASWGYTPLTKLTAAFKRTLGDASFSMLDYAMASANGTATEFESMRRLYRVVSQRLRYTHYDIQDDSSITFIGAPDGGGMSLDAALLASKPGTELAQTQGGQCQDYSSVLAALARASGILSRVVSSTAGLGGWYDHYFPEVYIPDLPHHGGKTARVGGANSDADPWYVFDATDPRGSSDVLSWGYWAEAIAPRAEYGRARDILYGPTSKPWDVVTSKLTWDPLYSGTLYAADVASVAAAYSAGPEYWLTTSGVTGWIGSGDKDVYRISKETTGAKAVRVRTLPSGGEYLAPAICVAPASGNPVMPVACTSPTSRSNLPSGESYVVVFNNVADPGYSRILRGDSIQYVLELEY